jgi:DNA-binding NarL/FixJ family response regulator
LVEEHRPDLLVTGILMPDDDLDGIEVVRRAGEAVPTLRAIVLSLYDDSEHIAAAMAAGAVDYVLKTAHPDALRAAIQRAFAHSRSLTGLPTLKGERFAKASLRGLTRREREILQLVAEGHSNAHVARMLWVTEQTVKFHLSNVYRKLNVTNRTEASRWAQLHGLLAPQLEGSEAGNAASLARNAGTGVHISPVAARRATD